ncbi:hypothetical protein CDAR_487121 [Caerostris darwini]|uniref:Uncharacterized protein n=1 Tax=Caerostris darwini TaxID=1538125 RepID=A0AAV4TYC9_9ARAC|nr:hypothetical protein CDAR_487121 [Caerostris darwini]
MGEKSWKSNALRNSLSQIVVQGPIFQSTGQTHGTSRNRVDELCRPSLSVSAGQESGGLSRRDTSLRALFDGIPFALQKISYPNRALHYRPANPLRPPSLPEASLREGCSFPLEFSSAFCGASLRP